MATIYFSGPNTNSKLVDANGNPIGTNDASPLIVRPPLNSISAFGAVKTVDEQPEVHLSFLYNINTAVVGTTTANGGTVTQANSQAVLQTTTATNGSARLASIQMSKYTPGQGMTARFTAVFTPGVVNSQQEIGFGDTVDGFFFGYVGASFGIIWRKNSVDTFIAQANWNVDPMDGTGVSGQTLDPTKGNVYSIQVQWLGYGAIKFYIEKATTGELLLVHRLVIGNTYTTPSLTNPSLPLSAKVINSGNATNITLKTPSMGVYREGVPSIFGVRGSASNRKTAVTTELNIITLKNNPTFAGITNKVKVRLGILSLSTSVDTIFRVILNPTIGGTPSFTDFDTNTSVVSIDTAGTSRTGGRVIFTFVGENGNGQTIYLKDFDFWFVPGDTVAITATSASGNAAPQVAVNWFEEF